MTAAGLLSVGLMEVGEFVKGDDVDSTVSRVGGELETGETDEDGAEDEEDGEEDEAEPTVGE